MEIQLSDSQTLRVFVMAGSWFRIPERFLWKTMEGPSTILPPGGAQQGKDVECGAHDCEELGCRNNRC